MCNKVCGDCEHFTEDTEYYLSGAYHDWCENRGEKAYYCGKTKQFWIGAKSRYHSHTCEFDRFLKGEQRYIEKHNPSEEYGHDKPDYSEHIDSHYIGASSYTKYYFPEKDEDIGNNYGSFMILLVFVTIYAVCGIVYNLIYLK